MTQRIVLTGGHGVGKSSLLLALEERGEHVVHEAARDVRLLAHARGIPFPEDQADFEARVLTRHLTREDTIPRHARRVFLDRGAPDHLAYATLGRWPLTPAQVTACRTRRYDHVILVEGPPGGVATLDRVEAAFCHRLVAELKRIYAELRMPVQRLAWADLDTRAEAILAIVSDTLDQDPMPTLEEQRAALPQGQGRSTVHP
jgi:predicted ATPase